MGCIQSRSTESNSDVIRKALLIGINYFGTKSELRGCINDTINLKRFLISKGYFKDADFVMMNDRKFGKLNPTRMNILQQLSDLVEFAERHPTKNINIFVAYSGHGSHIEDKSGDEYDGYDEMLCPVDYIQNGFILDDDVKAGFIDLLPSNVNLFMLVDACHSGTMGDLKYEYFSGKSLGCKINEKSIETECNVVLLSGARDAETAADAFLYDSTDKQHEYQGAMTAAFIANYDDGMSYRDIIATTKLWLKLKKYKQNPQLSSGKLIDVESKVSNIF